AKHRRPPPQTNLCRRLHSQTPRCSAIKRKMAIECSQARKCSPKRKCPAKSARVDLCQKTRQGHATLRQPRSCCFHTPGCAGERRNHQAGAGNGCATSPCHCSRQTALAHPKPRKPTKRIGHSQSNTTDHGV